MYGNSSPGGVAFAQHVAQLIDEALVAMRSPETAASEVKAAQMGEDEGSAQASIRK